VSGIRETERERGERTNHKVHSHNSTIPLLLKIFYVRSEDVIITQLTIPIKPFIQRVPGALFRR